MMISTKGRYALRIMTELAAAEGEDLVPLRDVARKQEISEKYMEAIIKSLVKAGLVIGLRGMHGLGHFRGCGGIAGPCGMSGGGPYSLCPGGPVPDAPDLERAGTHHPGLFFRYHSGPAPAADRGRFAAGLRQALERQ